MPEQQPGTRRLPFQVQFSAPSVEVSLACRQPGREVRAALLEGSTREERRLLRSSEFAASEQGELPVDPFQRRGGLKEGGGELPAPSREPGQRPAPTGGSGAPPRPLAG